LFQRVGPVRAAFLQKRRQELLFLTVMKI